jgi:hypothetical protein
MVVIPPNKAPLRGIFDVHPVFASLRGATGWTGAMPSANALGLGDSRRALLRPICATYKLRVYTPLRLLSTAGNVSRYLFTTYSNLEKL